MIKTVKINQIKQIMVQTMGRITVISQEIEQGTYYLFEEAFNRCWTVMLVLLPVGVAQRIFF